MQNGGAELDVVSFSSPDLCFSTFLWLAICNPKSDTRRVLHGNKASRGAKNSLLEIRHLFRKMNWTSITQRTEQRRYWCSTTSSQNPERWQSKGGLEVQRFPMSQFLNYFRKIFNLASSLAWDTGSDFLESDSPSMMSSRLHGQQEHKGSIISETSASPPFCGWPSVIPNLTPGGSFMEIKQAEEPRKMNWTSITQRTEQRRYWCSTTSSQNPERWQSKGGLEVQRFPMSQFLNYFRKIFNLASSLAWDTGSDFLESDSPSMMSSRLHGQQEHKGSIISETSASPPFCGWPSVIPNLTPGGSFMEIKQAEEPR
ncbi:uncharacterized protein LOC144986882 [Oryzias latipes]